MERKQLLTAFLAIAIILGLGIPFVLGALKPLIVLSSSMEPAMSPGDLAIVRKTDADEIERGDIMAFEDPEERFNVLITHRVIGTSENSENLSFETKGDAVEEKDLFQVEKQEVVGKVVFVMPYLGYLFNSGQTLPVFLGLILAPAFLIIFTEVRKIFNYSNPIKSRKLEKKDIKKKRSSDRQHTEYKFKRLAGILLISLAFFGLLSYSHIKESNYNVGEKTIEPRSISTVTVYQEAEESIPKYEILRENKTIKLETEPIKMISTAPHIITPYWTGKLAEIHPKLPGLITALIPPLIISIVLFPIWKKSREKSERKKRGRSL